MKKQVVLAIKIALGIACFVFLWFKLRNQFSGEKLANLTNTMQNSHSIVYLMVALVMVFPNWLLESYKWKKITASIERISFSKAIKGVLAGVCIGNLTPGRFGEFAGRIIYFSPHNRSKVSVTHFVCGSTQLFTTLFFGLLCAAIWLLSTTELHAFYIVVLICCGGLLLGLFLLLLNIEWAYSKLAKSKFLKRFDLGKVSYPRKILLELIGWSAIRYWVFSTQYILLLQACGAQGSYWQLFIPVSISFMLMSSIPMISFIEVAVRASIAVILFSSYNSNELLLVTASTLLWFINIAIPSIVGYFIILSTRIKLKEEAQT